MNITLTDATAIAASVLFEEAFLLDHKLWKQWLALYDEDCTYWVPAWKNEYNLTEDPDSQISLIYHSNRYQLEERTLRIQSRKSITAMPLPRTLHVITNLRASSQASDRIRGDACFSVHVYDPRSARQHLNAGRYEFELRLQDDSWLIARKKVILINDCVPTALDFYSL